MDISEKDIAALRGIVEGGPLDVLIVTHTNPDGDAVGSSLAWAALLRSRGHRVECVVPNRYPSFLEWVPDVERIGIFKDSPERVAAMIAGAQVIFCMDFNQIHRLEGMGGLIEANTAARLVLIDHHLDPPAGFDIVFSHPDSSSTSYVVYRLIERLAGDGAITRAMAEQIYVGIMTDTGNFSYSFLTPDLFRAIAALVEKGIDPARINRAVYHSFTADRLRLLGYTLGRMQVMNAGGEQVACMSLTEAELRRFNYRIGDSEGFVNYPLSIRGMAMSVIFIATHKFIRVSLRSREDVDASAFARRYFEGGGHKNAAGGKSYLGMKETVERFREAVKEYFGGSDKL